MVHTGQHGEYQWLVSGDEIWDLADLVVQFHQGFRLAIAAFDSGPLQRTKEHFEQGWNTQAGFAISPCIDEKFTVPQNGYDEWYLFENLPCLDNEIEVFVNYIAFTLTPPVETDKTYGPTWEQSGREWLEEAQLRFWWQLERLRPMTFVASGDNDVVVSRNSCFLQAVRETFSPARPGM